MSALTDIESVISAASSISNPVSEALKALTGAETLSIDAVNALTTTPNEQLSKSIRNLAAVMDLPESDRAIQLGPVIDGMLANAGQPVAPGVSTEPLIGIRVGHLLALGTVGFKYIRDEQVIEAASKSGKS